MKKKILCFVIVLCTMLCIFSALSITASAEIASGTCGDNLNWVLDDDGTLTISGTGEMENYGNYSSVPWYSSKESINKIILKNGVTTIGSYAFENCSSLTSVSIPDGVTSIGVYTFENCSSLTSVSIPDSVTSIGYDAFYGCSSLTSVDIPDSVTSIGHGAFSGCSSLTSVSIPDSVTSIGYDAFYGCSSLTSVSVGDSVTYIGMRAFLGCSNLKKVYISDLTAWCNIDFKTDGSNPLYYGAELYLNNELLTILEISDGVVEIKDYAFYNCSSLTSVSIGDSVTSIKSRAFYNCSSLTSVSIGDSVTSIGDYAFYGCNNSKKVYISDLIAWCNIDFSGIYSNPMYYGADLYLNNELLTTLEIPDEIVEIKSGAFRGCHNLTSVSIPDSVTSIGVNAFYGCSGLENVVIGDGVTSLDGFNFKYNTKLKNVVIGDSVTSIGYEEFYNCSSLTSITIPDSVTSIGYRAFYGCSGLENVVIGDGVTSLAGFNFENNTNLKNVVIGDSVTSIGDYAFKGCNSLTSVVIGDGVTSIGRGAFSGCSSLTSVSISDRVTSIGGNAFSGCSSLTSVTIGDSVTSIGDNAFYGCNNLKKVYISDLIVWCTIDFSGFYSNPMYYGADLYLNNELLTILEIPDGVFKIKKYAFYNCNSLTSVSISDSVTSIGGNAFSGCSGLENVVIGNGVTSLAGFYFKNNTNLKTVVIGDSVTSIGESAFNGCSSLTSVSLGDSVTNIGGYAFYGCSSLTSVSLGDSVTNIGGYAFYGCSSLTSINIPDSVTSIGYAAFYNCSSLTSVTIPDSVTNIGGYAFYGCSGLENIVIGNGVTSLAGFYFKNYTDLKNVVIGDSVTSIESSAFYGCSSLTSVSVGDSVTSIGESTFSNCSGLTSVSIGDSVTSIGYKVFENCSSLTSVSIPDSVTIIGGYAFYGCSGLTSVSIGDSVTIIRNNAFEGCNNLKEVYISDLIAWCNIDFEQGDSNPIYYGADLYLNNELLTILEIPDGVVIVDDYAFRGYSNLTSVSISDSVTTIGEYAFSGCSSLTSVTIGDSVTSIGGHAFYGCNNLKKVYIRDLTTWCNIDFEQSYSNPTFHGADLYFNNELLTILEIPDGVVKVGDHAFYDCNYLTSITIPDSVTSIGYEAFYGCSSLENVVIGDGVTSLNGFGFSGNTNLKKVVIGDSVTSIHNEAFRGCRNLVSITIGDSVTSIGYAAFSGCDSLTSVTIPDSVTIIGGYAFYGCDSLTSVTIPDSVTTIGGYAFSGCDSLTSVSIGDSVTSIGESAFSGCDSLTSVTIPDSVTSIGESAFSGGLKVVWYYHKTGWDYYAFPRYSKVTYHQLSSVKPTGVSLSGGAKVVVGKTIRLYQTIYPYNATNKSVTWSTSNSSVATVSGGVVKGIKKGTATITAKTSNGLTASRMVTVTEEALTITVYGVKKGLSYETYLLPDAKVIIEDGNTNHQRISNQNGEASFTKSDIESKIVKVSASCEDYVDYEGGIIFPDSTDSYSVYLKEKDDDIHFTEANIAINGKVKDLLNASSKVYVPYFTKSAINNKKAYQLIIDVDWGILEEGEVKLKGTKSGKEIIIMEGSNLIAFASEFEIGEGYSLTAKTKDKDGKEVTKTISLPLEVKVSDLSLGIPSTGVVKMDSGLYFLSDLKMGLSFGELVGADAEITLNKDTATVKLGASKKESVPAGLFDGVGPDVKVGGTVILPITENGEYGGGLYVSTGGKAKIYDYTHNLIINGVPLYINTEFSGGLNGELSLSGKNNAVIYTGKLEGAASGEISGGLGGELTDNLAMKAGVGGGVELKLPAEYKASTTGETDITFDPSLTGYFFLEAEIKAFLLEFEEQLKTGEIKWSKNGLEFGSILFELNDTEWKPAGRDYLKNGGGFTGDSIALMELSEGRAIDVIYENIISVADAYITNISGKPVLILTVDDKERDDANCLSIAYSVYDNGSWSEPIVIEDDGTLDTGVYASGKFVAWEDNNSQVSTMEEMLKTSDISVGVWNGEGYEVTSLTNDNVYDFGVKVKEYGDKCIVAWLSNTANDFTGTEGVTTVNYALYDNGWSEVNTIENVGEVTNVNVLFDESGYSVVYKNGATLYTVENGTTEETYENIGRYGIESVEEKTVIAYFDEEKALHITENGVEKLSFETDYVSGENPVVEKCNGKVYVFWAENDGIYYASNSEGEWCGRRCVVETDKTIESLSCTMVDEENYTLSYFETDGKIQNLIVFDAVEGADLAVTDTVYDEEAYANDDNFDYTVSVFNNGEITAKGGEVKIYENGECVYVTVFDNEIAPGETFEFSDTFCPENGRVKHEYVIEATTAGDYNRKNNTCTVSVGYSDVEVHDAYFIKNYDSTERLEVYVKNTGTVTMENVEVNVYGESGEAIFTETIENISGGATTLLEFDEEQKKGVDYRIEIVAENDENIYNNTAIVVYDRYAKALSSKFDLNTKTLTYEIVKEQTKCDSATVLIAIYNENGEQKSVSSNSITYSDYEEDVIIVEKTLADVSVTDSIKVFLWDTAESMKPEAEVDIIN